MQRIGSAEALWRYPVKGLAPESLHTAAVTPDGLAGDRASALFVCDAGHARFEKTYRGKEQRRLHLCRSIDAALALGASECVALEARGAGPYFDAAPVSLIFDRWLDEAAMACGRRLDPQRFRPNVFARFQPRDGIEQLPAEAELVGSTLILGSVRLLAIDPIERCVTIGYDPLTAEADPAIGRAIAQQRRNVLGVYCTVQRPGTIAQGDVVFIERAS
jgi:uncharacterized protein YcbX